MSVEAIHKNIKDLYNQVEDVTRQNPIAAIIYSIALKTISTLAGSLSGFLALGIFSISLVFDIAILTNLRRVCERLEDQFFDLVEGVSPERRRARQSGDFVRRGVESVRGFFDGSLPEATRMRRREEYL